MKNWIEWNPRLAATGLMTMLLVVVATSSAASSPGIVPADAPCTDSAGASTGFFCQPLSAKGKLVPACSQKKPRDSADCQGKTAQAYCEGRRFSRAVTYGLDGQGNLAEVVCSRSSAQHVAGQIEEWQPMFNVDLRGYDHREFGLARRDDWKTCKAACDGDGRCQAWTVSQEASTCYLKWEKNAELLSSNPCCITGIKGMASAGAASGQKGTIRTPEELKRLGNRVQGSTEDQVGRHAEDAVRRGIDRILGD